MIVLRRRVGERVMIGEGVWIEILACKTGSTLVGITAPEGVKVLREELVDSKTTRPPKRNEEQR